jgi:hypothetical protein
MLFMAIISMLSVALVNAYLANTLATSVELQRIKAQQLLDASVRYAALSLASPRVEVSASAIPSQQLVYSSPEVDVKVSIENESGFIDLLDADKSLLESVLMANGAAKHELPEVLSLLQSLKNINSKQTSQPTYRQLRDVLQLTSVRTSSLMAVTTLHNDQKGIHPELASEQVLALVPSLSKAELDRLLLQRKLSQSKRNASSLISNPVINKNFSSKISPYYRITSSVQLVEKRYSQVVIIKMTNLRGRLFDIQARL